MPKIKLEKGKTIKWVVKSRLCTGCGTCAGICPTDAIEMVINQGKGIYVPKLNEEKCTDCGLCLEVCPGHSVDFKQLNQDIFGKQPEDILLGNYLNCYIGHATDYDIRYNSASGGLVTALLIFALEERIIDGALVTRMKKDKPLEPEPFIARTREEIIEASKSKYCPVPANIALKEILNIEEGERFAVVGLPCHIHGVRKAEAINKKLKERVVLHLGIFCWHSDTFKMTDFLFKKWGVNRGKVTKLDYRGEGWPGAMSIVPRKGKRKVIPFHDFINAHASYFFVPSRCVLCCEQSSELADISFGDAWLPECMNCDKVGKSLIIVRSKSGEQLMEKVTQACKVMIDGVDSNKVTRLEGGKKTDYKA